jgi:hypothetical protein
MTDATDNIVLEHLRAIRTDIAKLHVKVQEIASTQSAMLQILANHGSRLDRMEGRRETIEKRLGLVEA